MSRAPAVVDLVSSSSEEDDCFPVEAPNKYIQRPGMKAYADQLDEPMEIEEDEPLVPTKMAAQTKQGGIAVALESALRDMESEEDEAFDTSGAERSNADDEDGKQSPMEIDDGNTEDMVLQSKYAEIDREEGELSDEANIADDEAWQQKQLEAAYLREAQVAHRKAALLKLAKASVPNALRKKKAKKLKRKLQDALLPPPNMGYSPILTPPRMVHLPAPESILRVHRHPDGTMFSAMPPPILLPPSNPFPPPLPAQNSSPRTKSPERTVLAPENDHSMLDLESLRNAVKRSVKRMKSTSEAKADDTKTKNTPVESPVEDLPPVAPTPSPTHSLTKMALGPNNKTWSNPLLVKKPLTACTQTLVINLSVQDCEEMRRRHQHLQMTLEEIDPIQALKQKIAAREEELRRNSKPTVEVKKPLEVPSSDPVQVAKFHVQRLESRISELKYLIAQKEQQQQRGK